jgi:hypothetical protein
LPLRSPAARLLIEQAEALGEPLEDPLLLFSVLYGLWIANTVAFNGAVARELAEQFLPLAEKQAMVAPRMVGHRLMGMPLLLTGLLNYNFCEIPAKKPRRAPNCGANSPMPLPLRSS